MTLGIFKWIFVDIFLIISAIAAIVTKHKKAMNFRENSKIEKYFESLMWLMGAVVIAILFR